MAVSFAQAQASLLATNFLDTIGATPQQIGGEVVEMNRVAAAVIKAAAEFATTARANLNKYDQVSSGGLSDSIEPKIVEIGNRNVVDILVNDYYKFVDRGVRGYKGAGKSTANYSFKSKYPSRKMVAAIKEWLRHERSSSSNTKVAVTPREARRLSADPNARAFNAAMAVKKKGIKGSGFWTEAIRKLEKDFANDVADALVIDVIEQVAP